MRDKRLDEATPRDSRGTPLFQPRHRSVRSPAGCPVMGPGSDPDVPPERRRIPKPAGDVSASLAPHDYASGAVSLSPRCLRHHAYHCRWQKNRQSPWRRRRCPQRHQGRGDRPGLRRRTWLASWRHRLRVARDHQRRHHTRQQWHQPPRHSLFSNHFWVK